MYSISGFRCSSPSHMYNSRKPYPLIEALLQLQSSKSVIVSNKCSFCVENLLSKGCSARIQAAQLGCLSVPAGNPSIFGHDPSLYTRQHHENTPRRGYKVLCYKEVSYEEKLGDLRGYRPCPIDQLNALPSFLRSAYA